MQTLRAWLDPAHLNQIYGPAATLALEGQRFPIWLTQTLRPQWLDHQRQVIGWVHKACEFFQAPRPPELWFAFPELPPLETPPDGPAPDQPSPEAEITPVAIATGLGWMLGGPLGAAVLGGAGYWVNQLDYFGEASPEIDPLQRQALYRQAADYYLSQFSHAALEAVQAYEFTAQPILLAPIVESPTTAQATAYLSHQRRLLQATLAGLEAAMDGLGFKDIF